MVYLTNNQAQNV